MSVHLFVKVVLNASFYLVDCTVLYYICIAIENQNIT